MSLFPTLFTTAGIVPSDPEYISFRPNGFEETKQRDHQGPQQGGPNDSVLFHSGNTYYSVFQYRKSTRERSLANLKIVSYELFFHDSLSSISVRLGSCNKTLDYLLL